MTNYVVSLRFGEKGSLARKLARNSKKVPLGSKAAISQSGTWIDRCFIIGPMCAALNAQKVTIDTGADPVAFIYLYVYVRCTLVHGD